MRGQTDRRTGKNNMSPDPSEGEWGGGGVIIGKKAFAMS